MKTPFAGEPDQEAIVDSVKAWVREFVVGLNLCPFARKELDRGRVRFVVAEAENEEALLVALHHELQYLERQPDTETTLLIVPRTLDIFDDYNDFLPLADDLLRYLGLEGIYQIASFHPDYRFEGTAAEDPENYTNRSPFPLLHLLREDSLEQAIDRYPDVEEIPQRNIDRMNRLGMDGIRDLLKRRYYGRL